MRGRKAIGGAMLLLTTSCHPAARAASVRVPEGTSNIIVHSSLQPPVDVGIRPAMALTGGAPGAVLRGAGVERVERFPVALSCELGSVCLIGVPKRLGALVFAFDAEVEVVIDPPAGDSVLAVPRYLDPHSTSAALGDVLVRSSALAAACEADSDERSAAIEAELRRTADDDGRAVVRDAAALALVQTQCTGAAANRRLARGLLDELDPSSPALSLWTDAVHELGALANDQRRANALLDRVIDRHPQAEVGGRLLLRRLTAALASADARAIEQLEARLREPRFAATTSAAFASLQAKARDPLHVAIGDPLPELELPLLSGDRLSTGASRGRPLLLYVSASWCRGCIAALPSLRRLAREHPELQIAYVLWDESDDARTFVQQYDPVPGTVALADDPTRAAILATLLKHPIMPSFVLVGSDGHVLATSKEHDIAELDALLSVSGE